jgi:hypothetical protein
MAAQGIATKILAETFKDISAIHGTLCARTSQPSVEEISGLCAMLPRNGRENGLRSRRRARSMAERRMFAKTIVLSDAFLDMPTSARCLYFTLGMLADDDGFVNSPKSIMRQAGASTDDLNLLMAKRFILAFESGIIETGEDFEEEAEFSIRRKSFSIKPMSVEEAIMQMNLLEHEFFVFRDSNTEEICVVYKRHGNTYGLIEDKPE